MNELRWKDVSEGLRRQGVAPQAPGREDFWSDFRARARMVRQDGLGAPAPAHPWRWAAAAATTAAAMAVIVFAWLPARPVVTGMSEIKSLEVIAPHSGMIIMNDDSGRGTILWITGLNDNRSG
jgi:hypothetical protein